MIGEVDGSDFAFLYAQRRDEIDRLAHTQRMIGMTPEEVASELRECLWKAFQTFDQQQGLTFGQYWWSVWTHRKSDLLRTYFAKRRTHPCPVSPEDLAELVDTLAPMVSIEDLCPSEDRTERAVWWMLSAGYNGVEVRRVLRLSWRAFNRIMDGWRTPEIRTLLT